MTDKAAAAAASERMINVGVWLWNVLSAVGTIFTVKQLMRPTEKGGCGFNFSITLSALHYAACAAFTYAWKQRNAPKGVEAEKAAAKPPVKLPLVELVGFVIINDLAIVFLNMSLLMNPVFFYQIMKLTVVPFVALVEYFFFNNQLTGTKVGGIGVVVVGIYMIVNPASAAQSNVVPSLVGCLTAVMSVVCAGLQQISCRMLQKKYNVPPVDLLDSISWIMALSIGGIGPFFDYWVTQKWVWNYQNASGGVGVLIVSMLLAISINLSQFIFLGRMPATTFQVVGHVKTVLVLFGGVVFFGDKVAGVQWAGVALTISGIVIYTLMPNLWGSASPTALGSGRPVGGDQGLGRGLLGGAAAAISKALARPKDDSHLDEDDADVEGGPAGGDGQARAGGGAALRPGSGSGAGGSAAGAGAAGPRASGIPLAPPRPDGSGGGGFGGRIPLLPAGGAGGEGVVVAARKSHAGALQARMSRSNSDAGGVSGGGMEGLAGRGGGTGE